MLSKNVVLIETINSTGTGLIYPCHYNSLKNSFIVITNSHVLEKFTTNKSNINYKDDIFIHFYDDLGKEIDRDEVIDIKVFNKTRYNMDEDIAAVLLVLKNDISLTLEKNIFDKSIENREKIFMEGYPGVMLNDQIYQKIQLEGQEKAMFPKNNNMGIYQVTDDYHWYNNFNDKKLIEGLSGSPVYCKKNGEIFILGISQSVSDICQGENPFKIVYYLKMEHVLDYLRKNDCIIYSKVNEFEYKIVWTLNEGKNNTEDITMLMIGSSGSGKSTFAKNFAYYGNKINSTNDGQTTRTNVIYEYSVSPKNTKITIKLLNKDDFKKQMIGKLEFLFFKNFIKRNLGLKDENIKNEHYFLNNIQALLQIILSIENDNENVANLIDEIWGILRGEINNNSKLNVYENIVIILGKNIENNFLRYIIDENHLEEIFNNLEKDYANELDETSIKRLENLKTDYEKEKIINFNKFKQFQREIIQNNLNKRDSNNSVSFNYIIKNIEELFRIEGYFDIQEFNNIFPKEYEFKENIIKYIDQKRIIKYIDGKKRISNQKYKFKKNIIKKTIKKTTNIGLYQMICKTYDVMHKEIIREISKKFKFINNKKEIDISRMNEDEQKLVEQCLQVTEEGSLTGIIDYVKVEDRISNEYAMIIWELGINKIKLIDTCGFDHVESDNKDMIKERLLKNLYKNEKNDQQNDQNKSKFSYSETNILYFKKLDSGKPDELRYMLPSIKETIPAAPVYCVFTGIDIFYKTAEEIKSFSWKNESKKNPKAINYILSEKGYNDLNAKDEYDNMYLTLKNNLVAYCGLKELEISNFQIYNSNVKGIRKVLTSISMKEYSSLEIVDINEDYISNEIKNEVEQIIKELFLRASIHNKYYRWNTKKADISGHKRKEVGYSNTYNHLINQLFHEAFTEVVNNSSSIRKILKKGKFKDTPNAVYASLKNMENKFIGNYYSLANLNASEVDKNEFRNIIEKMYESDVYKYNPYKTNKDEDKYICETNIKNNINELFKDIFNFEKGINENDVLKKLTEEFIHCLKKQIDEDNAKKSKNMINLNQEFVEKLSEFKYDFIEKYSTEKGKCQAEKNFKQLMSFYFKLY